MSNTLKKNNMYSFSVIGAGYVGMSFAALVSEHYSTKLIDISEEKIRLIKNGISPIKDEEIERYLKEKNLFLNASINLEKSIEDGDFVILAAPTNYNEETKSFDTSILEEIIHKVIDLNRNNLIVIKSTIPVGFTLSMQKKFNTENIIHSPEFLREGSALMDNLYPSRIVIGSKSNRAKLFGKIIKNTSLKKNTELVYMDSTSAECVKLFSNTYLAMRVAFFNELDTYALSNNLDSKSIINGVSLDDRIGNFYNNPSFGYGGYCLPKDTKQLLANYQDIPQKLISAIVESNDTRKDFISEHILKKNINVVGIYRLIMKSGSDNFRESAILGVISRLIERNVEVIIYEPNILNDFYEGVRVIRDLKKFKFESELIIANRTSDEIVDVSEKIFSRDLLGSD